MVVMADPVPSRTEAQRMRALGLANEVRVYRARLKDEWRRGRAGERTPRQVLAAPAPLEETWKVFEVLVSLPTLGRVKANRLLNVARVSPSKTLAGLTDRQRTEVLALAGAALSRCGGTVRS